LGGNPYWQYFAAKVAAPRHRTDGSRCGQAPGSSLERFLTRWGVHRVAPFGDWAGAASQIRRASTSRFRRLSTPPARKRPQRSRRYRRRDYRRDGHTLGSGASRDMSVATRWFSCPQMHQNHGYLQTNIDRSRAIGIHRIAWNQAPKVTWLAGIDKRRSEPPLQRVTRQRPRAAPDEPVGEAQGANPYGRVGVSVTDNDV
jgi:hypothetical protein